MSGLLFWLQVVKMSWEKNSKKKPILLVNFCFPIHFDFSNTRILTFSPGSKVMNPKMPLCRHKLSSSVPVLRKRGCKVQFLGQGCACNSAPNGPNKLKFCIQGAFVGYY